MGLAREQTIGHMAIKYKYSGRSVTIPRKYFYICEIEFSANY